MGVASTEGLLIRGVGSSSCVLGHILTRGLGDLPGVMEGPPTMKAEKKVESHFDSALILASY